ncbi:PLD nuclease N-terminal domain-containing protein [Brachybacterium sp. NPDC056505]|uniref:PLD nuclease N-terminal domain-containing protein n=1 Tax=Brachybacterium sp. NPDC056505 TaxID=3345843 RepID=UPI003670608D
MLKGVLAIASIGLTIFALADCVQCENAQLRGLPKWAWIVLIVLLPWVGPLTWLLVGKDREDGTAGPFGPRGWQPGQGGAGSSPRPRPLAPDEDPDFLRKLDEDIRRERRERGEHGDDSTS